MLRTRKLDAVEILMERKKQKMAKNFVKALLIEKNSMVVENSFCLVRIPVVTEKQRNGK